MMDQQLVFPPEVHQRLDPTHSPAFHYRKDGPAREWILHVILELAETIPEGAFDDLFFKVQILLP
jgi:hypothetical protein